MRRSCLLLALLAALLGAGALLLAAPLRAQAPWAGKPYTDWSKRDVERLLRDSPWAKRYVLGRASVAMIGREAASDINLRANEGAPHIFYQVQLRSAPPLRQALVRQSQLAADYHELPPPQRSDFDRSAQAFLSMEFPDTIVVYVEYGSNVNDADRQLAHHWQNLTGDLIRGSIYLTTPSAGRITMLDYIPLKGGARAFQITFPRVVNGRPVVAPGDRTLVVEFPSPSTAIEPARTIMVAFDLRKMVVGGQPVY